MSHRLYGLRFAGCIALAAVAFTVGSPAFASGDLDPDFGSDGKVIVDLGGSNEHPNAIVRDPAGHLYLAGGTGVSGTSDFAVLALDAHGDPVASFGSGGKAIVDMGGIDGANAITRDAAGNLYVAGSAGASGALDFAVLKLDANGHPVTGFGNAGKVTIDIGGFDRCTAVVLDTGGNVYLVGASTAAEGSAVVAKLDASGHLVAGYGNGGIATAQFNSDIPSTATIDAAGRIVATGFYSFGPFGGGDLVVTRIDASGQQSTSFGDDGVTMIYIEYGDRTTETSPGGIALDAGGNIYLAGYTDATEGLDYDLAVIKLDAGGHLASGFGNSGIALVELPITDEFAAAIAVDAGGHVYAGGSTLRDGSGQFLVAELDAGGQLVGDFGSGGVKTIAFSSSAYGYAMTLASDRVYVAGSNGSSATDFAAAALIIGSSDAIFGNGFD